LPFLQIGANLLENFAINFVSRFTLIFMRNAFLKTIYTSLFLVASALVFGPDTHAQTRCLQPDDIKKMVARLESPEKPASNEKLGKELVKMQEKVSQKFRDAADFDFKAGALNRELAKTRTKNDTRLCEILKSSGWPGETTVGEKGAWAAFYLVRSSVSLEFQAILLPVITAAVKKGELEKDGDYAAFLDRLRVRAGRKQLFGTQTVRRGDFLVLLPLQSDRLVDVWRREYNMSPLSDYIKGMELNFRTPLIRSRSDSVRGDAPDESAGLSAREDKQEIASVLAGSAGDDEEIIRVDTSLVSLPVYVYDPAGNRMDVLAQKDFEVSEDGTKQDITFFSATDAPFDLVLLIDLSGSTAGKVGLIIEATNRFIEAKRPGDKLAIVAFADKTTVVSTLTDDREKLLASVKTMNEKGGSKVWDALKFTIDNVFEAKTPQRRRAVVFLTDGVDNSLLGSKQGSRITFSELFEALKENETSIFPIYLDTEDQFPDDRGAYQNARNTLNLMADTTGGLYYKARSIEDLSGVYTQVMGDLSRVYTLGYVPTDDKRDGTWRNVRVDVPGRPALKVKTKAGYYAK
jgi:VWFA-related protein